MKYDKNYVERVRQRYPAGTRIRLDSLCNDEPGMPPGLCGTVMAVDDQPALLMKWDNGRSLSLFPGKDTFQVIAPVQDQETEANNQLFKKLQQEQKEYEIGLCALPFDEVLSKSWETVVRRDILMELETNDLQYEQAAALLELPNAMDELAQKACDLDTRHMDDILECIEERANSLLAGQNPGPSEQSM